MTTKNQIKILRDALQGVGRLKDLIVYKNNVEIKYKQEAIALSEMFERINRALDATKDVADQFIHKQEDIGCKCSEEEKNGETEIMCCNKCGLPVEDFWVNQKTDNKGENGNTK